jgi:hypothetical protein
VLISICFLDSKDKPDAGLLLARDCETAQFFSMLNSASRGSGTPCYRLRAKGAQRACRAPDVSGRSGAMPFRRPRFARALQQVARDGAQLTAARLLSDYRTAGHLPIDDSLSLPSRKGWFNVLLQHLWPAFLEKRISALCSRRIVILLQRLLENQGSKFPLKFITGIDLQVK